MEIARAQRLENYRAPHPISYTMEFSHYDQVPGNVQQQIVSKAKVAADEEE